MFNMGSAPQIHTQTTGLDATVDQVITVAAN